eukprot:Hpha_TRINITY_DN16043_c0_g1::TRINITY_DN16043_c0_g1_i1::g.119246::m.119246
MAEGGEWGEGPPQPPPNIYELLGCHERPHSLDPVLLRCVTSVFHGRLDVSNNLYQGEAVASFPQGYSFAGEFVQGKMGNAATRSAGALQWSDGLSYAGELQENEGSGTGIYSFPNGDSYEGEVLRGYRHGVGKHTCRNGDTYQGKWKRGKKHGQGVMTYAKGGTYDGEWVEGRKHGEGRMLYPSGSEYTGQWENDVRQGHGSMVWRQKGVPTAQYAGAWLAGKPHGTGTQTYQPPTEAEPAKGAESTPAITRIDPSGHPHPPPLLHAESSEARADPVTPRSGQSATRQNRYVGSFVEGRREGQGIFYYVDGAVYEGLWRDNTKHGEGKLVFANGACYLGDFEGGLPAKGGEVRPQVDGAITTQVPLQITDLLVSQARPDVALHALQCAVSRNHAGLRRLYAHYASAATPDVELNHSDRDSPPMMSMLQFWKMLTETRIVGPSGFTIAEADRLLRRMHDPHESTAVIMPSTRTPTPKTSSRQHTTELQQELLQRIVTSASASGNSPTNVQRLISGLSKKTDESPTKRTTSMSMHTMPMQPAPPTPSQTGSRRGSGGSKVHIPAAPSTVGGGNRGRTSMTSYAPSHAPTHSNLSQAQTVPARSSAGQLTVQLTAASIAQAAEELGMSEELGMTVPERAQLQRRWSAFRKGPHDTDNRLDFREFVEALVRLAAVKYARASPSLEERFQLLISNDIRPNAGAILPFFKETTVLLPVAQRFENLLRKLFKKYSERSFGGLELHKRRAAGDGVITVRQLLTLLRESGVVGTEKLGMRRVLSLFNTEEPVQIPQPHGPELLPVPHAPLMPMPPQTDKPLKAARSTSQRSNLGVPGLKNSASFMKRTASSTSKGPSRELSGRQDSFCSSVPSRTSRSYRNVPSQSEMMDQDRESEVFDSQPCSTPHSAPLDHRASAKEEARLREERISARRQWQAEVAAGKGNCNVTQTILVDRELVFAEFVDALARVARLRLGTEINDASKRFETFVDSYLDPALHGHNPTPNTLL